MRQTLRIGVAAFLAMTAFVLDTSRGEAHKPITSPYTYNDDVFPLLRDRCGRCHVNGGVAPMSLLTHAETVPWGESIKTELLAGQMPPWSVDTAPGRFRNVEGLTAREMNVLLTWVTGGTPIGGADKDPQPVALDNTWRLGEPDLALQTPSFTLAADTREATAEFVVPITAKERRFVRAVDLRPGTPAIVRAATVSVKAPAHAGTERVLALWLPGDTPVALDHGLGYELPAGAELVVRVLYRKTWEYERKEMTDRSAVGVYFASEPATIVRRVQAGTPLDEDVRALAIYPDGGIRNRSVRVVAQRPDSSRVDLIAFHPRPDWARRYWFTEPIPLPKGTRIEVTTKVEDEIPLLSPTLQGDAKKEDPSPLSLILDVVPGH